MNLITGIALGTAGMAGIAGLFVDFGDDLDLPAWVPAIGSLIAVAVAVFVPWRQD